MRIFHRPSVRVGLATFAALFLFASAQAGIPARDQKDLTPRESDRLAIQAVLIAQQTAWNRGDVDRFLVGYWHSPALTFSGSDGISRGWDDVLARYKKTYPDRAAMGTLDFSDLEFRFLGPDSALVLGCWHLKRETETNKDKQNADISGVFSLVWQRLPEDWRIIHDHTSAYAASRPK
jgi:uncharacterized protein (TIGR02246 family)